MPEIHRNDLVRWLNAADVKFPLLEYYGWAGGKVPFLYVRAAGKTVSGDMLTEVVCKAPGGGSTVMVTAMTPADAPRNASLKRLLQVKAASSATWKRTAKTLYRLRCGGYGHKRYSPEKAQVQGSAVTAVAEFRTKKYVTWPESCCVMTFRWNYEATCLAEILKKEHPDGEYGIVHVAENGDAPAELTIPLPRTGLGKEGEWYVQKGWIIPA